MHPEEKTMTIHRLATKRTPLLPLIAGGALLALTAGTALADDVNLAQTPFQISLGTFTNSSSVKIRADGETANSGTEINWGDTFGDVEGTKFRLDGYWRINDRHHVRLMYTSNSSVKRRSTDRILEWNGEEIPLNTNVRTEFGFDITELAYEYDFSKKEDRELVLTAGLHYTKFNASIKGTVTVPGGGASAEVGSNASVGAPLPVIGARGMWRLGHNWWFDGQVQFFQITFGDYDGSIINYRGAFTYQPKPWFGIGAGYDSFGINVDVNGDRLKGQLDWTYSGPQVFFNFAF